MDRQPRIHVLEDDDEIRQLVGDYLAREGFAVETAADAPALDLLLTAGEPDLIVMDLMLPGEDGLSVCRRLRARSSVPILMLTAKSDEIDRIIGIELGADDYLSKPFNPRELTARIRAILRRSSGQSSAQAASREARCAHLVVNYDRREARTTDGDVLDLSSAEYALLTVFLSRPQRVLDRDALMDLVHGRRHGGSFDRSIDVQVSRLRRKIEKDPANPVLIKTVRNGGYILAATVSGP